MRSPWLVLAPLAAPLLFIAPVKAQVGPPCCVVQDRTRPDDPHHQDTRDFENEPRPLEAVTVRSPQERELEATAEAPIPVEVPLANAIGIPMEPGETVVPEREPERAEIVEPVPIRVDGSVPTAPDGLIETSPCCQVLAERHPPDPRDLDDPVPFFIVAEIRRVYDRTLQAAVEIPIPAQAPRVDAIGIPLARRPGVSEPQYVAHTAAAPLRWLRITEESSAYFVALFVALLAICVWLSRRGRRPRLELESFPVPAGRPSLPNEKPWPEPELARLFEPAAHPAAAAAPARDLEPA